MARLVFVVMVTLCFSAPALAQKKKGPAPKAPQPQGLDHSVGDRFTTVAPITVAVDEFNAVELAKSIEAKDKEGVESMVDDKKAIVLDPGLSLVVLEITTIDRRREDQSSVCRVIKDGKAIGKYAVHLSYFTTAAMKREKKAD